MFSESADFAVLEANITGISGAVQAVRLGDSGSLPPDGVKVYTFGFPEGGPLRRMDGEIAGLDPPAIVLNGTGLTAWSIRIAVISRPNR